MTRIIGGIAGSLKLNSPAKATRPTADRIRESIFNRLQARSLIEGAKVLDLFAGTGALGLEAMSRGAQSLVMVEKDGKAASVCIANSRLLEKTVPGQMRVAHMPVNSFLSSAHNGESFDLVFIDPPYEVSSEELTRVLVQLLPLLSAEAVVMVERSSRSEKVELPEGYVLDDEKSYGDTAVFWVSLSS